MTTENSKNSSLQEQALHLIEANRVVETISLPPSMHQMQLEEWRTVSTSRYLQDAKRKGHSADGGGMLSNVTYSFVAPCGSAKTVQESTSSLLAARAHAKAGRSDYAWEALDSLFAVQASNGFLPKYRYSPSTTNSKSAFTDTIEYYVNDTTIPNWALFGNLSANYVPPNTSLASRLGLHGSGRVSAIPFHATAVLDIFKESNHTSEDLAKLKQNFDRIYRYHLFLHEVVMRGCSSGGGGGGRAHVAIKDKNRTVPCYNMVHPWESLADPTSLFWKTALDTVQKQMRRQGWTVGFDVPAQVRDAFDHPTTEVYNASIYLLECVVNATATCRQESNKQPPSVSWIQSDVDCEDEILSKCPFAMLDVGYAAALSKSDDDMLKIAEILRQHNHKNLQRISQSQMSQLAIWKEQSANILASNYMWDANHQTFMSRYVAFHEGLNQTFVPKNSTEPLAVPVGNNFMACWDTIEDPSMVDAMAFHLLQREGEFSFNCGRFPLWSTGGCDEEEDTILVDGNETTRDAIIYPALNYFVATGMSRNGGAVGVGHYVANSALNLVCGLPNTPTGPNGDDSVETSCPTDILFHRAYNGVWNLPYGMDECTSTSTETAAVVYNLMVLDKPFHYVPAPPIRSSWVIVLIAAELVMAFTIGVSCLVLSVNLMRRLKAEDGEGGGAFVHRLNSAGADSDLFPDDAYLSAAESFASDGASPSGDGTEEGKNNSNMWSGPSPFRSMFGV